MFKRTKFLYPENALYYSINYNKNAIGVFLVGFFLNQIAIVISNISLKKRKKERKENIRNKLCSNDTLYFSVSKVLLHF